jgi:hypothetical protein
MNKLVGDFSMPLSFSYTLVVCLPPVLYVMEFHLHFKAIAYKFRKDNVKAKDAFEKASKGQEMISSYPSEISLWLFYLQIVEQSPKVPLTSSIGPGMLLSIWNQLLL